MAPNLAQWRGPYVQGLPLDPWGRGFQYAAPGIINTKTFDIWSVGPDATDGADDIGNGTVSR